ncbi:UNVERIFIED_ORG: hypothetical protein J2Y81_008059 [Paraburkholderia sediminicola]|nr:hypothetical protein [Paraburkholderia sediminicola]
MGRRRTTCDCCCFAATASTAQSKRVEDRIPSPASASPTRNRRQYRNHRRKSLVSQALHNGWKCPHMRIELPRLMKPTRLAFTLALFCMIVAGKAAEPSPSITLEGTLAVGEFYGPPSYGENPSGDRIEHLLFLQLPATPTTQLGNSDSLAKLGPDAQRTYFVQVVVHDPERATAEKAIGHRVQIVGVPSVPLTGHYRAPLILDAKSLKPVDAWSR